MNIQQTINNIQKEFNQAIGKKIGYIGIPSENGIIQMLKEDDVKSFLGFSIRKVLESVIEECDKEIKVICQVLDPKDAEKSLANLIYGKKPGIPTAFEAEMLGKVRTLYSISQLIKDSIKEIL